MKVRKVLNVRMHLGGIYGRTTIDAVQHKAEMELTPVGVLVKAFGDNKVANLLLPFSNCVEVRLGDEVEVEEKRPVGRPPRASEV